MAKWVKSWMVESSTLKNKYKVSYGDDGSWGCSCPVWKFNRVECKHIREIIGQVGRHPSMADSPYEKPIYVITEDTNVPYFDARTNELRIPKGYPDDKHNQYWLETHICHIMLENGFSIREVRSIRGLDDTWNTKTIQARFETLGEFCPGKWSPSKSRRKGKKFNGRVRELMVIE